MRASRFAALLILWLMVVSAADAQHHSYSAEYDRSQPISLTGNVTKIEYNGFRVWLYLNAQNDQGTPESWTLEILSNRNLLEKNGWTKDTLKVGDVVSVRGWKARMLPTTGNKGLAGEVVFGGKNLMPDDMSRPR